MSLLRSLTRVVPLLRTPTSAVAVAPSRTMAETSNHVIVNMDDKGVATLQLNRKPVNGLNLELLTDLNIALEKLESQKTCKGIILTSANNGIFSAGLDILEMYQPDKARLQQFWRSLQDVWIKLYGSRPVTIAAINGHSPAGGCLLASACDYRIMAEGKFTIGLNETKLGIVAPFWFKDTMLNTVGHRETELALQLGTLYTAEEALHIKMVDELAPLDQLMTRAHKEMEKWLQIPEVARVLSKLMLRQPTIDKLRSRQQDDINQFVSFCMKDSVQKSLGMYMEALKKKQQSKI